MAGVVASSASSSLFFRINKLKVITTGSGGKNAGEIYCSPAGEPLTAGKPNNIILHSMRGTHNISHFGVHTVPNNRQYFFKNVVISNDGTSGKEVEVILKTRLAGGKFELFSHKHFTSSFEFSLGYTMFPAKTDFHLLSKLTAGTSSALQIIIPIVIRDTSP